MTLPLYMQGDAEATYTYDRDVELARRYAVRSILIEHDQLVHLDEGPWDGYFAMLVTTDNGVDASIPRGLGRARVYRSIIIPVEEADL